jgi:hypothetical protein
MSKNRNSKKFKKNNRKKNTNQSFVKKVELTIPKIEIPIPTGIQKPYLKHPFSIKVENVVRVNWDRYGVPFPIETNDIKNHSLHVPLSNSIKYNSESFNRYGTPGRYFHLTSPKNYKKIMEEGIRSVGINRMTTIGHSNKIWTVESDSPVIWNQISYGQLCVGIDNMKVVVLEIDPSGIIGEITSEEVGEFTSPLHTIINQNHIDVKYIKPIGYFHTSEKLFFSMKDELGKLKSTMFTNQYRMVG